MFRKPLFYCLCGLMFFGPAIGVQAQDKYPTKTIEITVGFNAGGSTDLITRVTADYIKQKWGIPVSVVNKPGGMSVPAVLEVYRAKPDGYSLLGDNNSSSTLLPIAIKDLPFKIEDRTYITITAGQPMIIIVPSSSPFKSIKEFEAEAKRDPGSFTWVSLGGVSGYDVVTRQFFKTIGIDISKTKPMIVQGGAPGVTMTAGGHVKWSVQSISASLPAIRGGTVRALAITGKNRFPGLPEVPTTAESGYPSLNYLYWVGLSGPKNMPANIVEKLNQVCQDMLNDPESVSKLKNVGALPFYHNSRDAREYVMQDGREVADLWGTK